MIPTGVHFAQADALRLPLADQSVDLCFVSPPYIDARLYLENGDNKGISRPCEAWVEWMLAVVTEMTRVCRGLVLTNCAGVTRNRIYQPGPEGLAWEWWKRGGNLWRPAFWHRVGIPGSGGKQWLRADVEYILCFKRDSEWLPWADNTANGHPPKWAPGGEMSHRLSSGARVNQWGHPIDSGGTGGPIDQVTCGTARPSHVEAKPMYRRGKNGFRVNERKADGSRAVDANNRCERGNEKGRVLGRLHTKSLSDGSDEVQCYLPPALANPGNLVKVKVGGGLLGHPLAHENEAPFPVDLAAWFIRGWCPPRCCSACGVAQEPEQIGQSPCKSGTDDHDGSQPTPERPADSDLLPEVRIHDRAEIKEICPSCGADLSKEGATRPGIVLDCFSGSGSTVDAAWREGRHGLGFDIRMSQCQLGRRRMREPYAKKSKPKAVKAEADLFGVA